MNTDHAPSDPPVATLAMISVDCPDAAAMARFYSGLLGWQIAMEGDGYAMLQGEGVRLGFGEIPDYRPPAWPNEGTKQFHLDLGVHDVDGMATRVIELGGSRPDEQPGGDRWTVLLDPAGHPFCLTDLANWG